MDTIDLALTLAFGVLCAGFGFAFGVAISVVRLRKEKARSATLIDWYLSESFRLGLAAFAAESHAFDLFDAMHRRMEARRSYAGDADRIEYPSSPKEIEP